tara:strand:- start:382 stop:672 length:291 start_codon:yes stop_codon:yes gene_type:complete
MNVAVPLPQQSWILGQRASWHTVASMFSSMLFRVSLKAAKRSPVGKVVRNQSGNRGLFRMLPVRRSTALEPEAMGSLLSAITHLSIKAGWIAANKG